MREVKLKNFREKEKWAGVPSLHICWCFGVCPRCQMLVPCSDSFFSHLLKAHSCLCYPYSACKPLFLLIIFVTISKTFTLLLCFSVCRALVCHVISFLRDKWVSLVAFALSFLLSITCGHIRVAVVGCLDPCILSSFVKSGPHGTFKHYLLWGISAWIRVINAWGICGTLLVIISLQGLSLKRTWSLFQGNF